MSYALGAVKPQTMNLGEGSKSDPILATATLMATGLLREISVLPPSERLSALRTKLDALYPGMADKALAKLAALTRKSLSRNQAMLDAIRLTLANRIADYTDEQLKARGLGADINELQQGYCSFVLGTGAAATGSVAAFTNPTAITGVNSSYTLGAQIAGCGQSQLTAQAQAAQAQAAQAEANAAAAAAAQVGAPSDTMTYALVGGGVLVVGLFGYLLLRRK